MVIIFGLGADAGSFLLTTFGSSKSMCRHAADFGAKISKAIFAEEIVPAYAEPTHLPDVPTEWVQRDAVVAERDALRAEVQRLRQQLNESERRRKDGAS
jgi:hypothetical protein